MNAIISKVSVFEAYFTYISTMLETLNAISAIEVQPEVSSACFATSTQVLGSEVYAIVAIGELAIVHAASVPATKNAMTQKNIEPRCGTATRLPQIAQLHTVNHVMLPLAHEYYRALAS